MATDAASLLLKIDSTQVEKGVGELDKLTAAGKRAEAAAAGVGGGMKSAGAQAAAMAASAQASARAATGMSAGLGAVAGSSKLAAYQAQNLAFQINDVVTGIASGQAPMRVFAQQSGQFYQIFQQSGLGARGFVRSLLEMIGVLKVTQNAELAAEAASAAAAAGSVRSAVQRATANIAVADTEIELALAAQRVAKTSTEAQIATSRLAAAYEAAALAARDLAAAENALAVAQGRATETAERSKAATVVLLGPMAGVLIGVGVAATGAALGFQAMKKSVSDSGVLEDYARSLGLSAKQLDELREKTDNFALTFGDVWNGIKKTISDGLDASPAWQAFKDGNESAFKAALDHAVNFAAKSYGVVVGAYRTIVQTWGGLGPAIGHAFAQAANAAIEAIEGLVNKSIEALNSFSKGVNGILGKDILGTIDPVSLGRVKDSFGAAGKDAGKSFAENVADATAEAQGRIQAGLATLWNNIIGAAEKRIADDAPNPPKGKHARKQGDHGLGDALAELDAQIKGQLRLAAAYEISDAAVMKAEALQKAEEQAIRHKGEIGIFYEKELALAVAKRVADAARTLSDLKFETNARKAANDAVAAGIATSAQANQQLELEKTLRPFVAAAAVAEGKVKENLLRIIREITQATTDNNREMAREQALREIAANDNTVERLNLEASLIGHSNRERAVALAQLEAMQKLRDMPGLSPQDQLNFIQSYINAANAAVRTPFQEWADTIPQTADKVTEALQQIEFKGFDSLASGITEVIMGTKSLGAAFKDVARSIIADIIQMTIRMLIFRAISGLFGGGSAPSGGFAKGGVFNGGNIVPFAVGGVVSGPTLFPMSGGRTGLMGEAGPEAVMPLARDSQGRLGVRAGNDNTQRVVVELTLDNELLGARIVEGANAVVEIKRPGIVSQSVNATMRTANRPVLMGRR